MSDEGLLIWMDLEMTGLDPKTERIIEMATVVTDSELRILAEGPELIIHQSDEILSRMDSWNRSHHSKSGLTDRVRKSSIHEREALRLTLNFVSRFTEPQTAPLAGNSVHQDRRFLSAYMPQLEAHLHYRNVDVSTIKELVQRWYPEILPKLPQKSQTHRALDDIKESIEELRYYREHVFR